MNNSYLLMLFLFCFSFEVNSKALFGKVETMEGFKYAFYEKVGSNYIMDGDILVTPLSEIKDGNKAVSRRSKKKKWKVKPHEHN